MFLFVYYFENITTPVTMNVSSKKKHSLLFYNHVCPITIYITYVITYVCPIMYVILLLKFHIKYIIKVSFTRKKMILITLFKYFIIMDTITWLDIHLVNIICHMNIMSIQRTLEGVTLQANKYIGRYLQ